VGRISIHALRIIDWVLHSFPECYRYDVNTVPSTMLEPPNSTSYLHKSHDHITSKLKKASLHIKF
jgi:hypothetical protein